MMEVGRIISTIFGNVYGSENDSFQKHKLNTRFYREMTEDEGEVIFCKNNVCIFHGEHLPGYFTLKACTIKQEYTRLVLNWTSNVQLRENFVTEDQRPLTHYEMEAEDESFPDVFHIDLTEMKTLKFFFTDDKQSAGHFVIGNHENHYKVFHFHLGGMNHLVEIFENWILCKRTKLPAEEQLRKKCFSVIPIYSIQPNQSFEESRFGPMTKERWRMFFNSCGQLEDANNFRKEVFFGGILPEVRHEAWPFLLHYYPFHSRSSERKIIKAKKTKEYAELSEKRLNMPKPEYDKFWLNVQCTVDKDVVRTDRSHPYFAGKDNPNVEMMRKILLNYAYYQPEVGYNQGMSDLLASILSTLQDEVDAFWCFVGLMEKSLFVTSPKDDSMDCQLLYLKELLRIMAVKFYAHLLLEDEGMDMLFCHRWLLLGFKREFHDMHVMRMWEACWSHYHTDFFHIFLCVGVVVEYGDEVWKRSMRVDEMLNYFNNMALQMDGDRVLRQARSLLHQFRRLAGIPCTLRGLLSGPGAWDSATLPEIECSCHESGTCRYSRTRAKSLTRESNSETEKRQKDDDLHRLVAKEEQKEEGNSHEEQQEESRCGNKKREDEGDDCKMEEQKYDGDNFDCEERQNVKEYNGCESNDLACTASDSETRSGATEWRREDTSSSEYETCCESPSELVVDRVGSEMARSETDDNGIVISDSQIVHEVVKSSDDDLTGYHDGLGEPQTELYVSE